MDNKNKFIIIILGLAVIGAAFVAFQSIQSANKEKIRYEGEIKKIRQDNDTLGNTLTQAKTELKTTQNRLEALQKEISSISSERDNWINKYEQALKEKEELVEQIGKLEEEYKKIAKSEKEGSEGARLVSDDSYWGNILKEKTGFEIELNNLRQQMDSMSIEVEELSKQNNDLTLDLNKVNQAKADLERQIAYSEKLSKALSEELVREKNDKKMLVEQLDKIKQDYSLLQQQLRDEGAEKLKIAKQMQDLKQEKQLIDRKVAELDQVLQDRMGEIVGIKEQLSAMRVDTARPSSVGSKVIELPPIVVQGSGDGAALSELSASVIAVNKANNFIVIDIGMASGVKEGMIFSVYRNNAPVGSIQIIQVKRDISAADIKSTEPGQQIEIGDKVKTR